MSMAKGLLPDTHPQSAGAARSTVLKDSDVVMLIGARLNWLLSHGKGKNWGDAPKKFIQIDIEPKEMDSNVEIVAPVVGDIASCVEAFLNEIGSNWTATPTEWAGVVAKKRDENVAKMAPRLMNNNVPMDYHGALGVLRQVIKERPNAILVNEGANTLDLARGIIDMYQPRKRIDVGTWGIMGIGMGYRIAAAIETGKPGARGRRRQRLRLLRHGDRDDLPLQPAGLHRRLQQRRHLSRHGRQSRGTIPATTVFVKGARYDKMIEAFGGVGVQRDEPRRAQRAVQRGHGLRQPTLINAVIDPAAGSESGRIGNLNPQSALKKKPPTQ
jgi:oxalyl-CoA decarboxylase